MSSGTAKNATSETSNSALNFGGKGMWNRYFRHRDSIKLYKNNMDSKVIQSQQFSSERSHAVSVEVKSEF